MGGAVAQGWRLSLLQLLGVLGVYLGGKGWRNFISQLSFKCCCCCCYLLCVREEWRIMDVEVRGRLGGVGSLLPLYVGSRGQTWVTRLM